MRNDKDLPEGLPDLGKTERANVAKTLTSQVSRIKGSVKTPSLQKAKSMSTRRARSLGFDRSGPSSGPDM